METTSIAGSHSSNQRLYYWGLVYYAVSRHEDTAKQQGRVCQSSALSGEEREERRSEKQGRKGMRKTDKWREDSREEVSE